MFVTSHELKQLRSEIADHPDVAPDERLRAIADVTIFGVVSILLGIGFFLVGFGVAFQLLVLLMKYFEGPAIAVLTALLGTALSMMLPTAGYQVGRRLQRRRLRRALRIAGQRRHALVDNVGSSATSVAVSSTIPLSQRR